MPNVHLNIAWLMISHVLPFFNSHHTLTRTALNPYLHVRFKISATFFSVLHAHMMYKSIAEDCKKICMALF